MKTKLAAKILVAALAALTVTGCNQADAVAPTAPKESLAKSASQDYCPKFTNFMASYASEITQCNMSGQSCVVARVYNGFKPVLECFGISTVSNPTLNDLIALPDEIVAKSNEFTTNPKKAEDFRECLCGAGSGVGSSPAGFGAGATVTGFGGGAEATGSAGFGGQTAPTGFGGGATGSSGFANGN